MQDSLEVDCRLSRGGNRGLVPRLDRRGDDQQEARSLSARPQTLRSPAASSFALLEASWPSSTAVQTLPERKRLHPMCPDG